MILKRLHTFIGKRLFGNEWYARHIGVNLGNYCEIYSDVSFGSEPYLIRLGNYVRVTAGVRFITHDGGMWVLRNLKLLENSDSFGMITVGNNVHIGMNVVVMPNVNIGDNVVIGCGAVVTKDIPSNSIAVGVPARIIESTDEYYNKHKDNCDFTKSFSPSEKKAYLLKKYNL